MTDRPPAAPPSEPIDIRPRAVVLDLGGVVVRICQTWAEGCAAAGVPVRAEALERLGGPEMAELMDRYQAGQVSFDAFAAAAADITGGAYGGDEIAAVHRAWTRGAYDGAAALVRDITAAGIPAIALSNTCREHWPVLMRMEVLQAFDTPIASPDVGACKPDPAMFAAAEAAIPHGAGDGPVVYYDDLPANVAAARAFGWEARAVDPHGTPPAEIRRDLDRWLV